jgi:hypothetical protein
MPKPEEILDFVIRTKAALMQLKGELTRKKPYERSRIDAVINQLMYILNDIEGQCKPLYCNISAVRGALSRFLSNLHVFSNEYPELTDAIDAVEIQALMSDP